MLEYFQRLFQFDHWANGEIAEKLTGISDPPNRATAILSHIFAAHWLWLKRLGEVAPETAVWPEIGVESYHDHNDRIAENWKKYLDQISVTDLELSVSYSNSRGEAYLSTAGDIITHLLHHSSYHRGQINRILREEGEEPPYIDMIHFVRAVRRR